LLLSPIAYPFFVLRVPGDHITISYPAIFVPPPRPEEVRALANDACHLVSLLHKGASTSLLLSFRSIPLPSSSPRFPPHAWGVVELHCGVGGRGLCGWIGGALACWYRCLLSHHSHWALGWPCCSHLEMVFRSYFQGWARSMGTHLKFTASVDVFAVGCWVGGRNGGIGWCYLAQPPAGLRPGDLACMCRPATHQSSFTVRETTCGSRGFARPGRDGGSDGCLAG